jgi:hypothetical protein
MFLNKNNVNTEKEVLDEKDERKVLLRAESWDMRQYGEHRSAFYDTRTHTHIVAVRNEYKQSLGGLSSILIRAPASFYESQKLKDLTKLNLYNGCNNEKFDGSSTSVLFKYDVTYIYLFFKNLTPNSTKRKSDNRTKAMQNAFEVYKLAD